MKFKTMLAVAVVFYICVYFTAKVLQSFKVLTVGDWGGRVTIRPVPVKTTYQLSIESVGTIVGWLIEEVSQFKKRPEDYVDTTHTENVLRKLSKEMGFSYDSIVEALTESESEATSDL